MAHDPVTCEVLRQSARPRTAQGTMTGNRALHRPESANVGLSAFNEDLASVL